MFPEVLPRFLATALLALLLAAAPAVADHSITELVSTGPDAGGPAEAYQFCATTAAVGCAPSLRVSDDGTHVFFETYDRLVGGDWDSARDVYERSGGVTTLVSTGPSAGNENFDAELLDASGDGSRVLFATRERLAGADQDSTSDIYDRAGNTTTLVSTGPTGADDPYDVWFGGASADARHVVFATAAALVSADTDSIGDVYERFAGTTTLVSTGPTDDGNAGADLFELDPGPVVSEDGSHIFFRTSEKLVANDPDTEYDFYERTGGVTRLVTTGPADTGPATSVRADHFGISGDGTHAIFGTYDRLTADDVTFSWDLYERSNGTTTTHIGPECSAGSLCVPRITQDGGRIVFFSYGKLAAEDTDSYADVYEYSSGTLKLVSTGPSGGNGPFHVAFLPLVLSGDGSHIFFATSESLVPEDTDGLLDIYERFGGTTTLVTPGPSATYSDNLLAASDDGARFFFSSYANLVPEDTDNAADIYERYAGTTTLISTGPTDLTPAEPSFLGSSLDGARVFFIRPDPLVSADDDLCPGTTGGCMDVYERRTAATTPQSVSPSGAAVPNYARLSSFSEHALP